MKTSTLMTMVLLSASCFAASAHPARDADGARPATAAPADTTTVAPAVAHRGMNTPAGVNKPGDTNAATAGQVQHWQTIALPKSHHLSHTFAGDDTHVQT